MIIEGRQYRYTARRGKLASRHGQTVTVIFIHRHQIFARFPDGHYAHIRPRHLKELNHANDRPLPLVRPAPTSHS